VVVHVFCFARIVNFISCSQLLELFNDRSRQGFLQLPAVRDNPLTTISRFFTAYEKKFTGTMLRCYVVLVMGFDSVCLE
jgi:hypothetical protein